MSEGGVGIGIEQVEQSKIISSPDSLNSKDPASYTIDQIAGSIASLESMATSMEQKAKAVSSKDATLAANPNTSTENPDQKKTSTEILRDIFLSPDNPYTVTPLSGDFDPNKLNDYSIEPTGLNVVFKNKAGEKVATARLGRSKNYDSLKRNTYKQSNEGGYVIFTDPSTGKEVARMPMVAGGAGGTVDPDIQAYIAARLAANESIDDGLRKLLMDEVKARPGGFGDIGDLLKRIDDHNKAVATSPQTQAENKAAREEQVRIASEGILRDLYNKENNADIPVIGSAEMQEIQNAIFNLQRIGDEGVTEAARISRIVAARVGYHNSYFAARVRGDAFEQAFQDISTESHAQIFRQPGVVAAIDKLIKYVGENEGSYFRMRRGKDAELRRREIAAWLCDPRHPENFVFENKDGTPPDTVIPPVVLGGSSGLDLNQTEAMTAVDLAIKAMNIFGEAEYYDALSVHHNSVTTLPPGASIITEIVNGAQRDFIFFESVAQQENFMMQNWSKIDMEISGNDNAKGQSGDDIRDTYGGGYALYTERKRRAGLKELRRFTALPLGFGIRRLGRFTDTAGNPLHDGRKENFLQFIDAAHNFDNFSFHYRNLEMREWSKQVAFFQKNHGLIDKFLSDGMDPVTANAIAETQDHHEREKLIEKFLGNWIKIAEAFDQAPNKVWVEEESRQALENMLLGLIMVKLKDQAETGYLAQVAGKARRFGHSDWNSSTVNEVLEFVQKQGILGHHSLENIKAKAAELVKQDPDYRSVRLRLSAWRGTLRGMLRAGGSSLGRSFFEALFKSIEQGANDLGGGGGGGHH